MASTCTRLALIPRPDSHAARRPVCATPRAAPARDGQRPTGTRRSRLLNPARGKRFTRLIRPNAGQSRGGLRDFPSLGVHSEATVPCRAAAGLCDAPCSTGAPPGDAPPAPHCHAGRDLRAAPAARRVRAAAGARLPARASACGASPQGRTHKMTVQISPSGSRFVKVIPGPVRRRSPRNACTWVENSPRPEHGEALVSRGPLARPHQKSGKLRLWPPRNGHMGVGRRGRKHSAPRKFVARL